MFRFFKLYSLYMNNTGFLASEENCVCEKLPRAVLHVPVNHYNVCELCGMIRRPPTFSSDEEEKMDAERQKILLQRRHAEEAAHLNKTARFKVAVKGKKPQIKSYIKRNKSDNLTRTEGGGLGEAGDGDGPKEPSKMGRRQEEPSAPPPSSPSPAPSGSPCEDTSYIRRRLIYDEQFVKKFIPLKGPITDPSGGAISKRSSNIWGATNPHISRPQGPLSKDKLQGGCSKSKGKYTESQLASQFHPFDEYEGPSEDAFVVDSARRMLSRPNSLYIDPRPDLPNNRIGNHGLSLGRIWMASHAMPLAPAPKIPEPPSGPSTNKPPLPEETKAKTKGSIKIVGSDTSSSPIYQVTKTEEHPGNFECEDILQDLGLIELSDGKNETTVNELANEDVFSSNKTMTDEEYSEIEYKEWGPGREPIIIDILKASEEVVRSISVQKQNNSSKDGVCPVARQKFIFKKQMNTKAKPVKNKTFKAEDRHSVTKSSLPKCSQCRRHIRNQAADSNPRKISRDSELELLKLKTGSEQRVCPVHPDTTKRFLCSKIPEFKMEKTVKTLVVTRKFTTFYKVYHMSVDLPKLHLASYVRQLSGILSESFVQNQPLMSFLEFRVPGIEISDLGCCRKDHKIKNNPFGPKTLITRMVDPPILQSKNKARAVWPSMRLIPKKVPTKVTYAQNFLQSKSLKEKILKHRKTKTTMRHNSLRLKEETECGKLFQEQNQERQRSPVPVPETNQDSEGERKMILAIVKHFRSIRKPLKKSRGF